MIDIVRTPYVRIVASTVLNSDVLEEFARSHGLGSFAEYNKGTPLSKIINASYNQGSHLDYLAEFAGRFCYRSWDKGRNHNDYLRNVISEHHGNVLAHGNVSFIITGVSRSLTHELVRHHVGTNPSQESQRYVCAEGGEIEIIGFMANRAVMPPIIQKFATLETENEFREDYILALKAYDKWLNKIKNNLPDNLSKTLRKKRAQEAARCFLPNASETRLVWTMNMRAARNVCEQRGNEHADLEIRHLAVAMTRELQGVAPVQMFDSNIYMADDGFEAVSFTYSKV